MNRSEYTGSIHEVDKSGRNLIWNGKKYNYVAKCNTNCRSINELEQHEFYCEKCNEIVYTI